MRSDWMCLLRSLAGLICLAALFPVHCTDVKGPPQINHEEASSLVIAKDGDPVRLVCPIVSGSHLIVQWTKDGETVDDTWPAFRISSRTLKVKTATESVSGVYVCRGISGYGTAQHEIKLIVLGSDGDSRDRGSSGDGNRNAKNDGSRYSSLAPPKIVERVPSSGRLLKAASESVRLKCASTGLPKPTIRWYRDGVQILGFAGERVDTSRSGQLHIVSLAAPDAGQYECRAINALGADTATFTLQVKDSYHAVPHIVTDSLANSTVYVGDPVMLQCQVKSESPVHIKWLKRLSGSEHSAPLALSGGANNNNNNKDRHIGGSGRDSDSGWNSGDAGFNVSDAIQLIRGNRYQVLNTSRSVQSAGAAGAAAGAAAAGGGVYTGRLLVTSVKVSDAGHYVCLAANSGGLAMRPAHITVLTNRLELDGAGVTMPGEIYVIIAAPVLVVVLLSLAAIICLCQRKTNQSQASQIEKRVNDAIRLHPRDTLMTVPDEKQRAHVLLAPESLPGNGVCNGVCNTVHCCTHDRRYDPLPPHPTPTPYEHTYNMLVRPAGSGSSRSSTHTASLPSSSGSGTQCPGHYSGQCCADRSLTPRSEIVNFAARSLTSGNTGWPSPALSYRDRHSQSHYQYVC